LEIAFTFALTGLLAGFMAGLLGIGGGFIVVPLLLIILPYVGIDASLLAHVAIGTSLACICITSISSSFAHNRRHAIVWHLLKPIVPGLIVGAIIGSQLAGVIQGELLVLIFISGALATAIYLLTDHDKQKENIHTANIIYFFYAKISGIIASLIGIGGGSLISPFLVYRGQSMRKAVGTAAACGFPIALVGSIGYIYTGWFATSKIEYTSGYVYWPAFLGIVIFSALSAPLGAKIAHHISEKRLKQLFATFLILTSGQIIYSQWFTAN